MVSHTRQYRTSDWSRLGRAIKMAYENVKADDYGKETNEQKPEEDTARDRRLTLEDFGGRSDALGG
jgi:hypothetical protein